MFATRFRPISPLENESTSNLVFVSSFFVTVASILGTGILGLPVHLARCGFWPFFASFILCFVAQACVVFFMLELLQYTHLWQQEHSYTHSSPLPIPSESRTTLPPSASSNNLTVPISSSPFNTPPHSPEISPRFPIKRNMAGDFLEMAPVRNAMENSELEAIERTQSHGSLSSLTAAPSTVSSKRDHLLDVSEHGGSGSSSRVPLVQRHSDEIEVIDAPVKLYQTRFGPDLHSMGSLLLGRYNNLLFNIMLVLHLVVILISYGLAGPQALGDLVGVPFQTFIVPFICALTAVILLCQQPIAFIISILTAAKGTALLVIVALVGYLGFQIRQPISTSWSAIGQPFLISTVALGGIFNVLPLLYQRVVPNQKDMKKLRFSVLAGLIFCWIVNVSWALFVLLSVPQTSTDDKVDSLARAGKNGFISTEPLVRVISEKYPHLQFISLLVRLFVAISVSVSFVSMGSGLKHVLDGYIMGLEKSLSYLSASLSSSASSVSPPSSPSLSSVSFSLVARPRLPSDALDPASVPLTSDISSSHHSLPSTSPSSLNSSPTPSPTPSPSTSDHRAHPSSSRSLSFSSSSSPSPTASSSSTLPPLSSSFLASGRGMRWRRVMMGWTWLCGRCRNMMAHVCRVLKRKPLLMNGIVYSFFFGMVLLIAKLNPKSFNDILSKWASLALNGSTFYVSMMVWQAQKNEKNLPLKLTSRFVRCAVPYTATYFAFAVFYDLVMMMLGA